MERRMEKNVSGKRNYDGRESDLPDEMATQVVPFGALEMLGDCGGFQTKFLRNVIDL